MKNQPAASDAMASQTRPRMFTPPRDGEAGWVASLAMSAVLELLSILVLPLSTARRAGTVAPRGSIAISARVQPIGPRGDDCSAPAGCGVRRRIERKV